MTLQTFLSDIASELVVGILALIVGALWHRWLSLDGKTGQGVMKVSPNRKAVVTDADDGEIYVTDERGTRNLTRTKAEEYGSMWAPNSQWIAFMSQRSGEWDVYVADIKSGKNARLTTGQGSARPYAWTSDSDLILDLGGSQQTVWKREIQKWLK